MSAAQTVTLTNNGSNSLQNSISVQITGNFTVASGCGPSLAGHTSCPLNVSYAPMNTGNESGTLTVTDAIRMQTVLLTGIGLPPLGVSLSPTVGMSFGVVGVGQSSASQTVTLNNNTGTTLGIGGISISGTGDFVIAANGSTCGATLAADASCTTQIVFTPQAAGQRSGQLNVTDSATGSPQILALSGTGLDFSMSANGATSQTVTSGQTATYAITLTPGTTGLSSGLSFACSGAPTDATCVVTTSPAPPTLATNVTLTVTVATGGTRVLAAVMKLREPCRTVGPWSPLRFCRPSGWCGDAAVGAPGWCCGCCCWRRQYPRQAAPAARGWFLRTYRAARVAAARCTQRPMAITR